MSGRGFEQFVEKAEREQEARRPNPFADMELVSGRAKARALVMKRLKQLRAEGKLRLTDILRQPEQFRHHALECLTHVWDGKPATGDNPFGDMRFRFKCEAPDDREYKIGVRIEEEIDVGGGLSVPGETSSYQMLEPVYVKIPAGAVVELDVVKGLRLLMMYGSELATRQQLPMRPWIELDAAPEGFDAVKTPKRERAA